LVGDLVFPVEHSKIEGCRPDLILEGGMQLAYIYSRMQSSGSEGGQSRLYDTGNADIQTQGSIILYINPSVNTRDKLQLKIVTDVRQDQQRAHTSSFAAEELLPLIRSVPEYLEARYKIMKTQTYKFANQLTHISFVSLYIFMNKTIFSNTI
jgi:hypothetical protein